MTPRRARLATLLAVSFAAISGACATENPSRAFVENAYPVVADGGAVSAERTVYRVWWTTTLFSDPVLPGDESASQRVVPEVDYAYALIARGWHESSGKAPAALLPMRSRNKLVAKRGDTLRIQISATTLDGDCEAGDALSQDVADFITQRIFPGEFAGTTYDASQCQSSSFAADGGSDEDDASTTAR